MRAPTTETQEATMRTAPGKPAYRVLLIAACFFTALGLFLSMLASAKYNFGDVEAFRWWYPSGAWNLAVACLWITRLV